MLRIGHGRRGGKWGQADMIASIHIDARVYIHSSRRASLCRTFMFAVTHFQFGSSTIANVKNIAFNNAREDEGGHCPADGSLLIERNFNKRGFASMRAVPIRNTIRLSVSKCMYVCELRVSVRVRVLLCLANFVDTAAPSLHELYVTSSHQRHKRCCRAQNYVYIIAWQIRGLFFFLAVEKVRSHACEHAINVLVFKNLCREKQDFFCNKKKIIF